jgi:hypothetical protein
LGYLKTIYHLYNLDSFEWWDIVNHELERAWKEEIVANLKALSQHLSCEGVENHERFWSG